MGYGFINAVGRIDEKDKYKDKREAIQGEEGWFFLMQFVGRA